MYYIFSKADILDKLDFHVEEEKIEDQLIGHRIDIKFLIKDEDSPDKK